MLAGFPSPFRPMSALHSSPSAFSIVQAEGASYLRPPLPSVTSVASEPIGENRITPIKKNRFLGISIVSEPEIQEILNEEQFSPTLSATPRCKCIRDYLL